MIEREIAQAPVRLRFDLALEAAYLAHIRPGRARDMRFFGLLGPVILVLSLLVIDLPLAPETIALSAPLRVAGMIASLLLTSRRLSGGLGVVGQEWLATLCTLYGLGAVLAGFLLAHVAIRGEYINGTTTVLIYGLVCLPGRFRSKLIASPVYFVMITGTLLLSGVSWVVVSVHSSFTLMVLAFTLTAVYRFERQDRRNYLLTAREAMRNVELAARNDSLKSLAEHDGLTGLLNRRSFDMALTVLLDGAVHTGRSVALALIDLDRFKSLNDRFGHLAGDACLRAVGQVLQAHTRDGIDLIARYGGEEFVIVMPGLELAAVMDTAERIRSAIMRTAVVLDTLDHPIWLTASFGVAVCAPGERLAATHLINAADRALYEAKSAGRNCVMPARAGAAHETERELEARTGAGFVSHQARGLTRKRAAHDAPEPR